MAIKALANRMTERVELFTRTVSQDTYGQEVITWVTLITLWAEVKFGVTYKDSEENTGLDSGQLIDWNAVRVTTRFMPSIAVDQTMRLQWRLKAYDVEAVSHNGRESTTLRCREGQKDGR